jgi:hypothetical protein
MGLSDITPLGQSHLARARRRALICPVLSRGLTFPPRPAWGSPADISVLTRISRAPDGRHRPAGPQAWVAGRPFCGGSGRDLPLAPRWQGPASASVAARRFVPMAGHFTVPAFSRRHGSARADMTNSPRDWPVSIDPRLQRVIAALRRRTGGRRSVTAVTWGPKSIGVNAIGNSLAVSGSVPFVTDTWFRVLRCGAVPCSNSFSAPFWSKAGPGPARDAAFAA